MCTAGSLQTQPSNQIPGTVLHNLYANPLLVVTVAKYIL